jgi:anthranilate phosphoribosyltransferase
VSGVVPDAERGVERARAAIEDGSAARLLDALESFGKELRR